MEIKFYEELVNRTIYEESDNFSSSYFRDVYKKAAQITNKIVNQTKNVRRSKDFERQFLNNIVAFVGGRGMGKTSALLSFAGFLRNFSREIWNSEKNNEREKHPCVDLFNVKDSLSFVTLEVIDPTHMDTNESIFEIVIAKMFSKFEEYNNMRKRHESDEIRSELLQEFEKTYRAIISNRECRCGLAAQNRTYPEIGIMDSLRKLSHSSDLRMQFIKLVNIFLKYLNYETHTSSEGDIIKHENRHLVIMIDDLDMSTNTIFDSSEEIRKYLMIPNVIILMTFKYEQYKEGILNHFMENDKKIELYSYSKAHSDPETYAELIEGKYQIVREYLEKMFPADQKINLIGYDKTHLRSKIEELQNETDLTIKFISREVKKDMEGRGEVFESLFQYISCKIFDKTRIRLPFMEKRHPFMPDNLREYHIYINSILTLAPYNRDKNDGNKYLIGNIDWFLNDIIGNWASEKLHSRDAAFLHRLYQSEDSYVNRLICKHFLKRINRELQHKKEDTSQKEDSPQKTELKSIQRYLQSRIEEKTETLGLVMNVLTRYARVDEDNERLVFATMIIYSGCLKKYEKKYKMKVEQKEIEEFWDLDGISGHEYIDSTNINIIPKLRDKKQLGNSQPFEPEISIERIEGILKCEKEYLSLAGEIFDLADEDGKIGENAPGAKEVIEQFKNEEFCRFFRSLDGETFDILYILFTPINYKKICKEFLENIKKALKDVMESKGEIDEYRKYNKLTNITDFLKGYSLEAEMDKWFEENKAEIKIPNIYPIFDLDFTNILLSEISNKNTTPYDLDEDIENKLCEAFSEIVRNILEYMSNQDKRLIEKINDENLKKIAFEKLEYKELYRFSNKIIESPIGKCMDIKRYCVSKETDYSNSFFKFLVQKITGKKGDKILKQDGFVYRSSKILNRKEDTLEVLEDTSDHGNESTGS